MSAVKEIKVPDSVQEIGSNIFNGDSSLEKLTLPFAGNTMSGSESLSALFYDIPESLTYLEITGGTFIPIIWPS